ncbi:two component sensor histidine kinase [Ameyamaea chiangmaiensis NBRC 103196]|uniref:histidine kinase n=1 Tax=Ameyamaea chiangmaiensis TaxID=442969 RepID=A0A850P362_9PROT|nr:ATP-binding protein [Ameyamaea chiangmaiensis]MBS4074164.1 HAMP domain-containing protein [Ameyamaea chiangmaiensis]NVN39107.1 HAMP domain-containing protein [Ameyamaea chiangmaiensis]GBQ71101.1 two component sensor histidine kinase [Ameyamaea chiangmaiensis NBRC 103196]
MSRIELFRTATFRLTLMVAGAMVAAMLAQFLLLYMQMTHFEARRSEAMLHREAEILARQPAARLEYLIQHRATDDLRIVINDIGLFDADGHYIVGDLQLIPDGLKPDHVVRQITVRAPEDEPYAMRFLAVPVDQGRILVLGRSLHMLGELEVMTRRAMWLSIVPTVAFALLMGVVLSHRALSRVKTMHEAIDRIMGGDLHERLPVARERDDLERLAGSVNRMLDRLEHLLDEIRNVGNDIAHDLRTPLTRVRVRLERALTTSTDIDTLREGIARAGDDLDQCFSVITALLRIGEIENGRRRAGFGTVDLCQIAADIVDLYEPIAETKAIGLHLVVPAVPVWAHGDRDLLVELYANLIDNAIKFTPDAGTVKLVVRVTATGPESSVVDTGIGIAESERVAVLSRFYRSDKSRHVPGSGLGLSLVSAIAALHGATLSIDAGDGRAASPGTRFRVSFPEMPRPVVRH